MKRYCLLFIVLLQTLFTEAQDIKIATGFFNSNEIVKAKQAITAARKNSDGKNIELLALEYKIDYALAGDKQFDNSYPDALPEGSAALLNIAAQNATDAALVKVFGINNWQPYNDCYIALINRASLLLNKEMFLSACKHFTSAVAISTLFYERKFITNAIDTTLVFYAGYSAMKAGNNINAALHFKRLADNNCYGTDLQIGYGWLSNYYLNDKKDIALATEVCNKGLTLYPADEYLKSVQTQILRQSGNMTSLFKNYEDVIASGKAGFSDYLGYGAELHDYLYVDNKIENQNLQNRLETVLKKALSLKNDSPEASYILGMHYTSVALKQDLMYRINKSGELKKSLDENTAASVTHLENAVKYYEAINPLKATQKEHLKTALQQLGNLYKYQGLAGKQKEAADKAAKL